MLTVGPREGSSALRQCGENRLSLSQDLLAAVDGLPLVGRSIGQRAQDSLVLAHHVARDLQLAVVFGSGCFIGLTCIHLPRLSSLAGSMVRTVPSIEHLNAVPEPQTNAAEENQDNCQNLKLLSVHGQSSLRNSRNAKCASKCKPKAVKSKRPGPALSHVMLWLTPGTMIAAPRMANATALSVVASSLTLSLFRFAASLRSMSSGVTSDLWFDAAT